VASDEVSRKNEMTRSFHHPDLAGAGAGHRGHRDGEKRERGKRGGLKSNVPTESGSPVAKVSGPPIEG